MSDKLLSEHLLFILNSHHTLCKFESSSELLVLRSFCWHHFLIYFFLVNTTFLIYVDYLPSLSFYTCRVRVFCIVIINRHYNHHQLFLLKLHLCSALFYSNIIFSLFCPYFYHLSWLLSVTHFYKMSCDLSVEDMDATKLHALLSVGELNEQMNNRFWKKYCIGHWWIGYLLVVCMMKS